MSQHSSVTGEIERDYEERARNKLAGIIHDVFQVIITEPLEGFNREFNQNDFPTFWPLGLPPQVEIDFFGHVDDIKILNQIRTSSNPNVHVIQSLVEAGDPSMSKVVHPGISPEKAGITGSTCKYALAEITHGGRKAAIAKADQLEKDCCIAMMKSGKNDVLDAVGLAIIVNPNDFAVPVFRYISSNAGKCPNLFKLMRTGRLLYVINRETITTVLAETNLKLEETNLKLEETNSKLEEKLEEMRTETAEIKELLKTVMDLLLRSSK
jgi:hypothetical protein